MPAAAMSVLQVLSEAGYSTNGAPPPPETLDEANRLLHEASRDPARTVVELLRSRKRCDYLRQRCARAVEAADHLQKLLDDMVRGHATLARLEAVRPAAEGVRAVCRIGAQSSELRVHPEVDRAALERLRPWEYVCIHENVLVDIWHDDGSLFAAAHGEVVDFKGWVNGTGGLARVTRTAHGEEIVSVAETVDAASLTPDAKLVLMRDNPRWAIAAIPAQHATCRFEVPIHTIDTQLSDLAGIEPLAEKLLLDVLQRIIHPEIRREYTLDPLRGMILSSPKPGMGKTAFMRAFARWLHELGQQRGFEVALYLVKPNQFKSMWHGEDARIVRDELFGALRARRAKPRNVPLVQLLVLDEVDSWGRRPEAHHAVVSSAQSDALEALLVELDGMTQDQSAEPPAHLLVVGMTNRPDRIDDALKRPGRLGDEVIQVPDLDQEGAEKVCAIYVRGAELPWSVGGELRRNLSADEIAERFLRPALAAVFPAVVLRYATDTQRKIDVTAGQMLAAVHYRRAMASAKSRAAARRLRGFGPPAVEYEDIVEGLLAVAHHVAQQMAQDPQMLIRHLGVKVPVARVDVVPLEELEAHRFLQIA